MEWRKSIYILHVLPQADLDLKAWFIAFTVHIV